MLFSSSRAVAVSLFTFDVFGCSNSDCVKVLVRVPSFVANVLRSGSVALPTQVDRIVVNEAGQRDGFGTRVHDLDPVRHLSAKEQHLCRVGRLVDELVSVRLSPELPRKLPVKLQL